MNLAEQKRVAKYLYDSLRLLSLTPEQKATRRKQSRDWFRVNKSKSGLSTSAPVRPRNIVERHCLGCSRIFKQWNFRHAKYCNKRCFLSVASSKKGDKSPTWKGTSVGYHGLHKWVTRVLGKPSSCQSCGTTSAKRFEWASKNHKYTRHVSDWLRLCSSCHKYYDGQSKKRPPNYQNV